RIFRTGSSRSTSLTSRLWRWPPEVIPRRRLQRSGSLPWLIAASGWRWELSRLAEQRFGRESATAFQSATWSPMLCESTSTSTRSTRLESERLCDSVLRVGLSVCVGDPHSENRLEGELTYQRDDLLCHESPLVATETRSRSDLDSCCGSAYNAGLLWKWGQRRGRGGHPSKRRLLQPEGCRRLPRCIYGSGGPGAVRRPPRCRRRVARKFDRAAAHRTSPSFE